MIRAILLLPTWLYYRAFRRRLPDDHPWRYPIPFGNWCRNATPLCVSFGFVFWSSGLSLLYCGLMLLKGGR